MSDHVPFEIQVEIMKRLPVKSLIQFRSVSKGWKSVIDSSDFIASYRGQVQHLLVRYANVDDYESNYVSILDDHTFPKHKVSLTIPPLVNMLSSHHIVGSSHGLLCFYRPYLKGHDDPIPRRGLAVVWNPFIRKTVAVVVPNVPSGIYQSVMGFGVCRETNDPKLVKITSICKNRSWFHRESIVSIPCQVEVFTLSTGVWRRPYGNLPRKSIRFCSYSVVVDGNPYWLADDADPGFSTSNLIMSFDTTSEEFRQVNLPDSLARPDQDLIISNLKESLGVLECDTNMIVLVVWMMEDSVSKSFTKLFTIDTCTCPAVAAYIHGFRISGQPVFEGSNDGQSSKLFVYEPSSKEFDDTGIVGSYLTFRVFHYTETLLLLDQPDLTVYNETETFISRDDLFQERNLYAD